MGKQLRDYQHSAIKSIEKDLSEGKNTLLLSMSMGLGKTFTAVKTEERLNSKKTFWVTEDSRLLEQSALAFIRDKFTDKFADEVERIGFIEYCRQGGTMPETGHKMSIVKADLFDTSGDIVFCSAQTLWRRISKMDANMCDVMIIDEAHCFPKGTMVDDKPIEKIKIGDFVKSFNHVNNTIEYKEVKKIFKHEFEGDFFQIKFPNGESFICTDNHPIYTKEFGYIQAKEISDLISSNQVSCLSLLNDSIKRKSKTRRTILWKLQSMFKGCDICNYKRKEAISQRKTLLQQGLFFNKKKARYVEIKASCRQGKNVEKNEGKQSYGKHGNSSENDKFYERKDFFISWRKWRINKTSNDASFSNWIRYGIRYTNSRCKSIIFKFTELLQSRFSSTRIKTCDRSRWKDSQIKKMEVFRQTENGSFKFIGVESCEIYKRGNREECGKGYEKTYVYNIGVEENHNYFVNNILVHNCFGSKSLYQGISHFDTRLRLGLSGTPFRNDGVMMGDIFEKISYEYGMGEGIKNGYLCELDAIRIQTNVNLDNVHTKMGDFNQQELSNEINTLARNNLIADSYIKYAEGRQAIGYGVNIQHCIDLAEAFKSKGINAAAVSSDEERTFNSAAEIINYKKGKLDVIFNVNLLSKGFDHPNTGCTIAAAPTKSLVRYLQGPAGRGSRLKTPDFVSKFGQNCIILDITDVTSKHNLVNAWELDKKKPIEERCFTTQDKKDKLLTERLAKKSILEHTRDKDERVKLLSLPPAKQFGWKKMQEAATPAQLKYISDLGYNVEDTSYTKQQCADIIALEPCNKKEIEYLQSKGYDTTFATKGQYGTIYYELEMKNKWKKK